MFKKLEQDSGDINCVRALAMSNNPFMYQMGLKLRAEALMDTARAFGLGNGPACPFRTIPAWCRPVII